MVKLITSILEQVWDLKILTGYRSLICEYGGLICGFVVSYSGYVLANSTSLPNIPPEALILVGAVQAFLSKKSRKFVKEHKEP